MQVLTLVEVPVHPTHLTVEHGARAVTAGMTVRHCEPTALATQVQDVLPHDAAEGAVPVSTKQGRSDRIRKPAVIFS